MEFHYILTEQNHAVNAELGGAWSQKIDSVDGLAELGFKPNEVDGLLFVIDSFGAIHTLKPAEDKSQYNTIIHSSNHGEIQELDKARDCFRKHLKSADAYITGDPRAIVYHTFKDYFLTALSNMNYSAKKISDKFF